LLRWFPSPSLGTDAHEALLQVFSGCSDDTGSWSLGTSGWMVFMTCRKDEECIGTQHNENNDESVETYQQLDVSEDRFCIQADLRLMR